MTPRNPFAVPRGTACHHAPMPSHAGGHSDNFGAALTAILVALGLGLAADTR